MTIQNDTKDKKGIARSISNKLTLFKMKKKNLQGQKCADCGWRKIKSNFSKYCPKCSPKHKGGI